MRGVVFASLACVLVGCIAKRPPPAPPRETTLGLSISSFVLHNGLRVVMVKDPRATEVQVTMRYQVGTVDDLEFPGMAHLVEHLMFQQVLGAQSLFAHLEDNTTYFNAFTSHDATTYISRAHPSHLDKLLSIEAVRVGFRCMSVTESAFAREREVVINEVRQRDEASELIAALHAAVYPAGHPYRERGAGTVASVGAITRDQACKFADAHYSTKNAVLVVSGNLSPPQLEASLGKFLARVAARVAAAPAQVVPMQPNPKRIEAPAPLDDDAVMIAWPLPLDPLLQIRVRALASPLASLIDVEVKGTTMLTELGDVRAPVLAIIVLPGEGETPEQVIETIERDVKLFPLAFSKSRIRQMLIESIRQTAIHRLYSSLEDDGDRDARLAGYVLAGLDPRTALGAEFQGLRELDEPDGIARAHLGMEKATIVKLKAAPGKKRGRAVDVRAAVHDLGQRRGDDDVAEARKPADGTLVGDVAGMKSRTLPNGLKVVLLPLTSVPTVDIRLVFGAGTADEPPDRRGAAILASGLTWESKFANDQLLFLAAGGSADRDVGVDYTSFVVKGVDMHLDVLLSGLRRWVRDGKRFTDPARIAETIRHARKKMNEDSAVADAWRTALYGAHPYARAGVTRHANDTLTARDAQQFRASHFTPDNATLVIAGSFDVALADRWIDYLFADWSGTAQPRHSARVSAKPASIARIEDLAQVHVQIALPTETRDRAQQLVAAAMLTEIARDVRHQLGASYTFDAQLAEQRLASNYYIAGYVDAPRAPEALQMLRERIDKLRTDPDTAARAFVRARRRVLTHLVSITGSATSLASRVQQDVGLARPPLSDVKAAAAVQALTIDTMTGALAELDLARAVVLMRGPEAELKSAFAALGRSATRVEFDQAKQDALADDPTPVRTSLYFDDDDDDDYELESALTEQGAASPLLVAIAPGYSSASVLGSDNDVTPTSAASGFAIAGEVGYRVSRSNAVGVHLELGFLGGTYNPMLSLMERRLTVMPLDIQAFAHASGYDRFWGGILFGLHVDRVMLDEPTWYAGLGIGLEGGVDLVKLGTHRLGVMAKVNGALISHTGYGGLFLGVAYRR